MSDQNGILPASHSGTHLDMLQNIIMCILLLIKEKEKGVTIPMREVRRVLIHVLCGSGLLRIQTLLIQL